MSEVDYEKQGFYSLRSWDTQVEEKLNRVCYETFRYAKFLHEGGVGDKAGRDVRICST